MKQILTLVAICLISVYSFAQVNEANRNPKKNYRVDNSGKLKLFNQSNPVLRYPKASISDPVVKYRLDSLILKGDEALTGEYIIVAKSEIIYNDEQLMTSRVQKDWYGTWIDSWKEDFYYNALNQVKSMIYTQWTENHWQNAYMERMTYNSDTLLQEKIYYNWNWTDWRVSQKVAYNYSDDSIVETLYLSENGWQPEAVTTYYLTGGIITSETCKSIYQSGYMENDYQALYQYSEGNLLNRLISYWEGSDWSEPVEKESYEYDSLNNMQFYSYSEWNPETSQWDIAEDSNPEYNNQYTRDELIIPYDMDELYFRHMLINAVDNIYYEGEPEYSIMAEAYFTPVVVEKAKNLTAIKTNTFPNPATDNITISWNGPVQIAQVTILNTTGAVLNRIEISNNSAIPISSLKHGLYMYTLSNGGNVFGSGKFVVL